MDKGRIRLLISILFLGVMLIVPMSGCGDQEKSGDGSDGSVIDYMVLVNKENPLPDGWEEALDTTTITNSVGDDVVVESTAGKQPGR